MKEFVFDLQRFKTSNLGTLKTLGKIITTLGLKKLAEALDKAPNPAEYLKKNANPILNFIGTRTPLGKNFGNYSTLITSSILIFDNALSILTDKTLPDATRISKIGLIVGDLEKMATATNKLSNSFKKKNLWFLSIFSAGISLTANLIAASDGITPAEKKKINKSYVVFMTSLGSGIIKEIFDAAVEKQLQRAFTEPLTTDLVEEIITNGKFFQKTAKTLTKSFGVVLTFASGILSAIDEHKARMEKYTDDGIPEDIAKHDAFIDALALFVHDTWSGYVKGVDDWIFNIMLGLANAETDKNYVEVIADQFKTLNYKNSGSSNDDPILISAENKSYIYGDNGNDSIENVASNVTIWGGHDNDTIWSLKDDSKIPQKNSIFGGPGNDFIWVQDKQSSIYGGKGNDTLVSAGTQNLLYGGAGNDTLISRETKNLLYGEAGDDYIFLIESATGNSVSGGSGNDLIFIDSTAQKNKFFYSSGDGNDTISGFGANDSLVISGKYSTVKSGSDFKVKVGKGSILLLDAADRKININNNVFNDDSETFGTFKPIEIPYLPTVPQYPLVSGTDGEDKISNHRSNVLIKGGSGNDSIYNGDYHYHLKGSSVTIGGDSGNDYILNYGNLVIMDGGVGNDTIFNGVGHYGGSKVTINGGEGNDSIRNMGGSKASISGGTGDDYILNDLSSENVSISGGLGNDSIENVSDSVKICGDDGDDDIYNGGDGVTISGGTGNDTIYNRGSYDGGSYVTIDGGTGNDILVNYWGKNVLLDGGEGNDLIYNGGANVLFKYYSGDGNDSVVGFNTTSTLSISGAEYTSTKSGSDLIVSVGKGKITLRGAASLSKINIEGKEISEPEWKLDGTTATYGTPNETLITVNGVKSLDGLSLKNKTVTVSKASLGTNKVTVSDGYTLALGSDVTKSSTTKAWSLNGTTATYKQTTKAGYTLANNSITYSKNATKDLITVNGVKSLDGLSLKNKVVTVSKAALGTNKVTVSDGYTLALGKDVTKSSTTKAWSLSGTTATYKQTTKAGYTLANNSITYSKKATKDLITVNGVKSLDGLSLKNKTVTVSKAALGTNKVTISDGYTLALGSDVTKSSTTKAWSLSGTTATYKQTTKAGYTLANNSITYSKKATKDLITVNGVKSLDGLSLKNKVVTVSKASLGTNKVTVSNGYTLALGSDVTKTVTLAAKLTNGKYTSGGKSAGYTLTNNTITYNKATASTLELTGVASKPSAPKNGVMTLNLKNFDDNLSVKSNSGKYKFSITKGTYAGKIFTGSSKADTIISAGSKISINAGKGNDSIVSSGSNVTLDGGAGNDTLTGGSGNNVFVYSAGNDVITDYTAGQDKIKIASGKISKTTLKGSDVVFTVGKGSLTVKNAKGKSISLIDSVGKASTTVVGAQTLTNSNKASVTIGADMGFVDASKRTKAVKITGNKLANTILGGSANDLLYGGAGNDSIQGNAGNDKLYGDSGNDSIFGGKGNDTLSGGTGNDIFVYTAGNDVITDYTADDKISLGSAISKTTLKGSDVVFTIGKGSLTVKEAKGKTLNIIDSTGKKYSTVLGGTTLTLTNAANSSVTATSKIKILDASKRTTAIQITGNKLANTIRGGSKNDSLYGGAGNDLLYGGKGNDTLIGGKGNDSLWGDAGADKFIYASGDGNDVIFGFDNTDLLQITGAFSASYNKSKKEIYFDVGSTANAITLKDFTATTFHVNNDTYKISGKKFIKQ